jgi:penicillin-binding protein 2
VYFYKVGGGYTNPENGFEEVAGIGLGIERLAQWMDIFGLGRPTGVGLAGEIGGTIPDPAWKRRTWGENWSTGDTYNSAFGQGYVLVTPIQMLQMVNLIANNGIFARPTLVREITDANGRVVRGFEPENTDIRDVLREKWPEYHNGQPYPETFDQNLAYVQEGMRLATTMNESLIHQGTAIRQQEALPYVPVAGKTGSAEFCDNIAAALERCIPGGWPAHAWYMSYAPYGNPEIAVIAFVYNGTEGATVALPIVTAVMDDYFRLKTQRALQEQVQTPQPSVPAPTPTIP